MGRKTIFVPYQPKNILNKHSRADHWFWTRYSAHPYVGCQHGCEFCYCREKKFSPYDDPVDFAYVIKVKENAPTLLRKALQRAPLDAVFTGDYQPAERKFELSRQMLQVCLELGFPVFLLERSALVLRDLELLKDLHQRARVIVAFSIISTPDSPNHARVRQMEHLAAPVEKRFKAMEAFAKAGLVTGTCCMPILPGLCDDEANLQNVVRWTADHGGQFVLSGGLTLSDQQREFFFGVLAERFPDLLEMYRRLYPAGSYGSPGWDGLHFARCVREFCQAAGIKDRAPRPVIPGEKRALNKRVVEALANQVYTLELQGAPQAQVWAYRKAAWAIEDLETELGLFYAQMGLKGLKTLPNVGEEMALQIAVQIPRKGEGTGIITDNERQ